MNRLDYIMLDEYLTTANKQIGLESTLLGRREKSKFWLERINRRFPEIKLRINALFYIHTEMTPEQTEEYKKELDKWN